LGAGIIHGIDNDPMAVEIAEKNLTLNKIDRSKFDVSKGDLIVAVHQKYNIVVSNILADVIVELLENVRDVLLNSGLFICSGFTVDGKNKVEEKLTKRDFKIVDSGLKEGWVAIVGKMEIQ